MAISSKRRDLIDATKLLLCQQGFEAMSPAHIIKKSGAGQGSFYHHFQSKADLAHHALEEISNEMIVGFDRMFDGDKSPIEKIMDYLKHPRDGVKGCKMGRFANEIIINNIAISAPVTNYFKHVENKIKTTIEDAQQMNMLTGEINANELAVTLVAIVQGGFVLSRIHGDAKMVNQATQTAVKIMQSLKNKAVNDV